MRPLETERLGQCDKGLCLCFYSRVFLPHSEDCIKHQSEPGTCHWKPKQIKCYLCSWNIWTSDCILHELIAHLLFFEWWSDVFIMFIALKDGYENVEQDLPAFEDLEGAARALMRLQDVYMLNVKGLARGVFQRVTGSAVTDLYNPRRLFSLTADDCFQVGKVTIFRERANCSALVSCGWNNYIPIVFTCF